MWSLKGGIVGHGVNSPREGNADGCSSSVRNLGGLEVYLWHVGLLADYRLHSRFLTVFWSRYCSVTSTREHEQWEHEKWNNVGTLI